MIFLLSLVFFVLSSTAQESTVSVSEPLYIGDLINFEFEISVQNDKIDLSDVLQQLDHLKTLDYEPPYHVISTMISKWTSILCVTHSTQSQLCVTEAETALEDKILEVQGELLQRIVYPYYYQHTQQGDVETFDDLLESRCASDCKDIEAVYTYSEEQYDQIYDKIRKANQTCQENILNTTIEYLEDARISRKCFLPEYEDHPVCSSMLQDLSLIKERVTDLADLIYGPSKAYSSETGALCIGCFDSAYKTSKAEQGVDNFYAVTEDIQEHSQCREINPGEMKTVHSGTGDNDSYKLKREPDGSYTIPLNIQFQAGENYDGSTPKTAVSQVYMAKAQKCLKRANTKMLGPNGEQLNIVLQQPPEGKASCEDDAGSHNITIESSSDDHRSNSIQYASDIDCPTITHEILHLLGLCDEYEEESTGFLVDPTTGDYQDAEGQSQESDSSHFQPAYDCRVTQKNSIMSNHYQRWSNVFDLEEETSLLNPEHFNAILYGKCQEKNGLFNQCSQLAYQSSLENIYCMQQKQECENQINVKNLPGGGGKP